jgi:hypothetical protein
MQRHWNILGLFAIEERKKSNGTKNRERMEINRLS